MIQQLRSTYPTPPTIGGDDYDAESILEEHPEITNVFYTTHAYLGADNDNPEVISGSSPGEVTDNPPPLPVKNTYRGAAVR